MTALTERRAAPADAAPWYRDPVSCLHTCLAALLAASGEDPTPALGLAWEFLHIPGDVTPVEYYWPCRYEGDLARSVLPHHPVTSAWQDADGDDPLGHLERALAGGRLPIVAVDNFHLPFRPAYQDVHSAHLVVIAAIDRHRSAVHVSDAMPPAFSGWLAVEQLLRAWGSDCPREDGNVFFGGAPIGRRWLDVTIRTPFDALREARVREALAANVERMRGRADGRGVAGLAGFEAWAEGLVTGARDGDARTLEDAYTFGWSMQASAAVHGEFLRAYGATRHPSLAEAGRRVERVAHHWSAVRITAAHGRRAPAARAADLEHHASRLARTYEEATVAVERALAATSTDQRGGGL